MTNYRTFIVLFSFFLLGCCDTETEMYELHKYYKDSNSPAAILMGGTYAGVVDTFPSEVSCLIRKSRAEADDKIIGYTNSIFVCKKKKAD